MNLLLCALTVLAAAPSPAIQVVSVHLLSKTAGAAAATPLLKRKKVSEQIELVVAIEADVGGRRVLFAGAPRVDLGDGKGARDAKAWPADAPVEVKWAKVEPTSRTGDNEKGGFHWDVIGYRETEWPAEKAGTPLARVADVRTTVLPDRGGLGTMAFRVTVAAGGVTRSTPGSESRWHGGLAADVLRVAYRRDDTFLGYLTELFNTPYIWASAGEGRDHQAEHLIGSDCADYICYGLRRAGKPIDYGFTGNVPSWGGKKALASIAAKGADGRYVDEKGNAVKVGEGGVEPGDLLLFKRHVGAFVRDNPPTGVLDSGDTISHTAWAPPVEQALDEGLPWTEPPFKVYRVR